MTEAKKPTKAAPAAEPEEPSGYPEPTNLTIAQRVVRVMIDADRVVKRGQTQFGERYSYARIDDVMAALREPMARHGLVLHWTQAAREVSEYGPTKGGAMQYRHTVAVAFELRNADLVDELPWTTTLEGDAIDTGDKGMGKALSYAFKNYLLKTFLLPSGDEADNEAYAPEPQRAQKQRAEKPAESEAEQAHRKAQSAFFATLKDQDIDKGVAKAWLVRNYKLESTKEATTEQLQGARAWALAYKKAQADVQAVVAQGGVDLAAIATFIGEHLKADSPETMNLAEWAEVLDFARKSADSEEPPGRGAAPADMKSMTDLAAEAMDKLQATREEDPK
jgi:hypothetical protein